VFPPEFVLLGSANRSSMPGASEGTRVEVVDDVSCSAAPRTSAVDTQRLVRGRRDRIIIDGHPVTFASDRCATDVPNYIRWLLTQAEMVFQSCEW